MNSQEFVDAVRTLVMEASVADTVSILLKPPGRSPSPRLLEVSVWFNHLSEEDREMAKRSLEMVARQAVFGVLAVLDGARRVTPSDASPEHFELIHVHGSETDILCGPEGASLHELL